ncbi:MAG: replication protein RepA [Syntrophobacteraceae bacterium]
MDRKDLTEIITETLAIEAEDAKKAGALGYMARALVQATLPHKAAKENEFTRDNGLFSLTILAPSKVGLPFGSIPRLLLSWMTTEAVYTRSPVLELGPTLSAFMGELGLARQGGKRGDITRLKKQTESLFCSTISCQYKDETTTKGGGFTIAKDYLLWWNPKSPDQMPLWQSTVTLSTDFFKEIISRPVPVDMRALKLLKRSPMALDIYFWLTYRMSYLSKDTVIPWPLLQMQFGADYATEGQGPRDFKRNFLKQLKKVHEVYKAAKVFEVENGLLLKPSPPHVAKVPPPLLDAPRRQAATESALEQLAPCLLGEEIDVGKIWLRTETFDKAREIASRLDIYALEQDWRDWIAKKGEMPKNPDQAFLGFVRTKAKQHT